MLLPLKHYDDSGRILPAGALYLCLLYLCRSYFVFIASLSFRQDSNALLAIFYPDTRYFTVSLLIALPAVLVLLVVSFREKFWIKGLCWPFKLVKPLMFVTLLADGVFHVVAARQQYWQFSWLIAITLLIDALCLFFVLKDRHLKLMLQDWLKPSKIVSNKN
jgi:hypothetical protein